MKIKEVWFNLTDQLLTELNSEEDITLGLVGEESLFLRFNNGKLRQATSVQQHTFEMLLQSHQRKVNFSFSLTGDTEFNLQTARQLLRRARAEVEVLPADPSLAPVINHGTSDQDLKAKLPTESEVIEQILLANNGIDFAGFYSGGPVFRASRNSKGQNHWFSTECFFYDYSLFTVSPAGPTHKAENKAVKGNYSEKNWNVENLHKNIHANASLLPKLCQPNYLLKPGTYRAYLAPGAIGEILGVLNGSFSAATFKQGRSPFLRLMQGQEKLSAMFSLKENFDLGGCPQFNSLGEMAPRELSVIENGELKNWVVSSKTAKEYNLEPNAGEITGWAPESMRSPEISGGQLPQSEALAKLGTGVCLGNLHYLNWSDVPAARVTGMTRYACFWVENGEIKAPIQDMRFDESIYRILGSQLEALTIEQKLEPNIMTYMRRELGAQKCPGALLKEFKFTL